MSRLIEGFEALMVLALAVVFGGVASQLREKSKNVTAYMRRSSHIALVAAAALVLIKYTSDKVVGFMFDRWHLLAYAIIVVVAAGLSFWFRKTQKSIPLVWAVIGLASGTGVVLHLFW